MVLYIFATTNFVQPNSGLVQEKEKEKQSKKWTGKSVHCSGSRTKRLRAERHRNAAVQQALGGRRLTELHAELMNEIGSVHVTAADSQGRRDPAASDGGDSSSSSSYYMLNESDTDSDAKDT